MRREERFRACQRLEDRCATLGEWLTWPSQQDASTWAPVL